MQRVGVEVAMSFVVHFVKGIQRMRLINLFFVGYFWAFVIARN
jgi:hypothetical protein